MVLFSSCSKDEVTPESEENLAPETPLLYYPTNNLVCIENILKFKWGAAEDPEGTSVSYEVQIARDNAFAEIVSTINTADTLRDISLFKGTLYYWRVKAIDEDEVSGEFSEIYNFYTENEGVANYLPFAPTLIAPEIASKNTEDTIALSWSAEDADGDDLTYDIYLGTDKSNLDKIASDLTETNFEATVNTSGLYYWKVVVSDSQGGTTLGQLWSFEKI